MYENLGRDALGPIRLDFLVLSTSPPTSKLNSLFQFGIYEFIRNEFITRQERDMPEPWLHEGVRRTLGLGKVGGTRQHDYVKDFLHNVILMEEELV